MSDFEGFRSWGHFAGAPFWQRDGAAKARGDTPCRVKICLVATDLPYLVGVLRELADRDDCYGVKFTEGDRDGMYLGRCFLTDPLVVGAVASKLKQDPKLMTTCQDDGFFEQFRRLN